MLRHGHKRHEASGRHLWLGWWADGGPLLTEAGIRAMFEVLDELVPEAMPVRYGVDEAYEERLEPGSLDGLVAFVDENREFDGQGTLFRVDRPARALTLLASPSRWGTEPQQGAYEVPWLHLELDAEVVEEAEDAERIAEAFARVAAATDAFYAEARWLRSDPDAGGLAAQAGSELSPIDPDHWWGLPVRAPFAAIIGPPYVALWPGFGAAAAGQKAAGPDHWTADAPRLAWNPPPELLQPFDCHFSGPPPPDRWTARGVVPPHRRSETWPFDERRAGWGEGYEVPEVPDPLNQVLLASADGDPESWVRESADPAQFGVWVDETVEAAWSWRITVAALSFVQGSRLEGPLRQEVEEVISGIQGVDVVQPDAPDAWLTRGDASGEELATALAVVVDQNEIAIRRCWGRPEHI